MRNITLKYGSVEDTITIKDFSFKWIEVFWNDGEVSITGNKRNNHRGYQPVLELNFEYDTQLNTVAQKISDAISAGDTIQYVTDDGVLPVVPEQFESVEDYVNRISKKPSTLVLEGNIQGREAFIVTGVLCGFTDVYCGQTNVLCGG